MYYDGSSIKILMGKGVFSNKPAYFVLRKDGVYGCYAKSRYGKTALIKIIVVALATAPFIKRHILLFDFKGEWLRDLTTPNYKSPEPIGLINCKDIHNFTFKFSDFDSPMDWQAMDVSDKASAILAEIAKGSKFYDDNIKVIENIVNDLEYYGFNSRWPNINVPSRHDVAVKSAIANFNHLKWIFWKGEEDDRKLIDWKKELKENPLVIINLGNLPRNVQRAYIGIILEKLSHPDEFLSQVKPLIICEEADYLFPRDSGDYNAGIPRSVDLMKLYTLKYQKRGVAVLLITQDADLIHKDIIKHTTDEFIGQLVKGSKDYDLTTHLKWTDDYREFILKERDGTYTRFVPSIPRCQV